MPRHAGFLLNGRYRLSRVLGQGGMGAVYLAADESLGGLPCAVKENLTVSPETERLFRREASLLATLRHPNLPRVTDYFVLDGEQYLVMDYVEGEDLKQRLEREGPLPEPLVLRWAAQLCEAVRYLHSLTPPVIHRDIKPANIKLTPKGQIMLVDFGVARPTAQDPRTATMTMAYTPGFAPPEQYGMGRTGPRSDQYALAATLYTLLVGQPPPDSVHCLLGKERLIPPREARAGLSERTNAALVRALCVKPEDRFPDLAAFGEALLGAPLPGASAEMTRPAPGRRGPTAAAPEAEAVPASAAPPTTPPLAPPAPPLAAQPTAPVPSARVAPAAPLPARPRARWPLYLLVGLLLIPLGIAAIATGTLAGRFLAGQMNPTRPPTSTPPATTTPAPASATVPLVVAPPTETPAPNQTAAPAEPATATPAPATATHTLVPTAAGTPIGSGGRLAFISNRDGEHYQIFTMNPDGSDVRQLTSDPTDKWDPAWTFGGTQLAWSTDGTRLLYVAQSLDDRGTDLFMINADGSGAPVNLTNAPGDDFHPAWCGLDALWFTSLRANNTHQLFTTTLESALDGQRPTNFSGTHNFPREYDPAPLAEGGCQRVLFVTTLGGIRPQIWRYFLDCPNCYRVLRTEQDLNGAAEEPALSADGRLLAYTRRLADSDTIMVGEVENRLTNAAVTDSGRDSQPQFSPDGQWVVFTSEREGNRDIFVMRVNGAEQTNLTLDPATDTDPVWQPAAQP